MFQNYSLGAKWIHTNCSPPLENSFINVKDGFVDSFSGRPSQREVFDFGNDAQILPAMINAHTHLELSGFPYEENPAGFAEWGGKIVQFRRSGQYNGNGGIAAAFRRQEILSETAGVADIVLPQIDISDVAVPESLRWLPFVELIAWRSGQINVPAVERLELNGAGLSPHAPHTVCSELLYEAVKQNVPLAMHLAETAEEIELLQKGSGALVAMMRRADPDYDPRRVVLGKCPMDYLQLLANAPKAFIIHGNYLDDEELRFLAAKRDTMAAVYCPRSHHYFGHPPYPLKKMLDFGVQVLLGTDSLASSPDLSIVNEMRYVLEHHRDVLPETVFKMGTVKAAAALGVEPLGTIQIGQRAKWALL